MHPLAPEVVQPVQLACDSVLPSADEAQRLGAERVASAESDDLAQDLLSGVGGGPYLEVRVLCIGLCGASCKGNERVFHMFTFNLANVVAHQSTVGDLVPAV